MGKEYYDTVADFTNGGSDVRRPDIVAPGRSLVSLRVPGSYVDTMHPEGRVEGDASGRFFRGSGTSQATAFVAGQVALLLSARPNLTHDQVKALLVGTARPLSDGQPALTPDRAEIAGSSRGGAGRRPSIRNRPRSRHARRPARCRSRSAGGCRG